MVTTAARYKQLATKRQPVLERARECAKLTLPYLIPPEGSSAGQAFPTPYQSVGAAGVLSLSAKTLSTILPPNTPFFRLDIEEFTLSELTQNPEMKQEILQALAMIERTTARAIEASNARVGINECLQHLIVSGNALVYFDEDNNGVRVFSLDSYVVMRDPSGNPVEIIAKESVAFAALTEEVQNLLPKKDRSDPDKTAAENHDLYTHIRRISASKWEVIQAVDDLDIESTRGGYPTDLLPWRALRWNRVDGEDYGRGHVEPHLGDLKSLEGLSKAILEYAAAAAKVVPLVNPNGMTDEVALSNAENLEFVSGRGDDVTFLHIDKFADFQVAKGLADDLTQRIEVAFLKLSSVQRNGERVTASEIRLMVADLEKTIGGAYALLALELQLPMIGVKMAQLTKAKRLPVLPKGIISPTITTGLDALNRADDLNKLDQLVAGLRDVYGPEALAAETNVAEYLKRRADALGLNIDGLIKSQEQKDAEAEAAQNAAMMQQLGPNAVNQMGGMAKAAMEQPQ